jgi:hypothetical protein
MYRAVKFMAIVGVGWVTVRSLPDVARYLKMRSM